jgi:hypothetical protein
VVWFFLVLATVISWWLGTAGTNRDGVSHEHELAGVAILVISFIKIWYIGMYFMELKHAPFWLRSMFDVWCVGVCAGMLGVFLWL